jgi:hypothetical protein
VRAFYIPRERVTRCVRNLDGDLHTRLASMEEQ